MGIGSIKEPAGTPDPAGENLHPHVVFARGLGAEERKLLRLRAELYGNAWSRMLDDLRARLAGRPFTHDLARRLEEDIDRVQKLQAYEQTHRIDLADYLNDDTPEA